MTKSHSVTRTLLFTVAASLLLAGTVDAQHLRYKTKSKMKIEGLGFLSGLLGGGQEEEVSVYGDYKRVDGDDMSTITDVEARRIIYLNHDKDEYSVVTFEEMAEMVDEMTAWGQEKVDEKGAEMEPDEETPEYNAEFDLKVHDTGKTEKIDGYESKQRIMIIETMFEPKDEAAADSLPSGSFYVVTDMWQADDIPEMEVEAEFNRKMGEALGREMMETDMASIMSQLLESDPRVGEAMEKAKEEVGNVEGMTLQSTMYFVTVPKGMELDWELAIGEKEEEKKSGGGIGGFLNQAAKAAGVDAGDDDEGEAEPKQSTLFSMETTIDDISDKERDLDYYQIPDDYDQVEFERPDFSQME